MTTQQKTFAINSFDNGVMVWQVTADAAFKNNIYCERSYCDPDSKYFIFQRHIPDARQGRTAGGVAALRECGKENLHRDRQPEHVAWNEVVACDFGAWERRTVLPPSKYLYSPEITASGELLAMHATAERKNELLRVNPETGAETRSIIPGEAFRHMAASPDGRYLAVSYALSFSPQMLGVDLLDLATGTRKTIIKDPFVLNPHLQFEPRDGKYLLIQYNRGGEYNPDGTLKKRIGPEGGTLFVASVPDGKIEWLKIGLPHTLAITGHEDWIPGTDEIILTTCRKQNDGKLPLMIIAPGKDARMLSETADISHVHASKCGRYYCGDRYHLPPDEKGRTGEIILGSIKTGKWVKVCRFGRLSKELLAEYKQQGLWYPEATPYFSPDLKWIVFNDATSGPPQLCVASVPESLLESCT